MACRYTYQGKTYEAVEFDDLLRAMRPDTAAQYMPTVKSMPSAPFVTSTDKWLSLALKRVITLAAQEGYDKVAFVNGEQSAERYDLSKQVRSIAWTGRGNDTEKSVTITPNSGNDIEFRVMPDGTTTSSSGGFAGNEFAGKRLDEIVGKDVAERIMGAPYGDMRGDGLKVGGEGMKAFYDKIVPTAANKLLAKLGGGKVEAVEFRGPAEGEFTLSGNDRDGVIVSNFRGFLAEGGEWVSDRAEAALFPSRDAARDAARFGPLREQPGFTITPAMREKASAGLPLFRKGADQTTGLTPTQFTQALSEAFGAKVADRLQAKGVVVPLADQNSLPAHVVPYLRAGDVVFGFYDPRTDRTYAVLENLTPDMVKGLAMHEVGVHYGFEAMLGADKYKQVMKQLDLMRKSGNVAVQAAYDQAKANAARPSQVPEETLAYLVQNSPENSVIKDVIARIKAWLFREFGIGGKYLTTDDLTALARAAVQHAARTEPGGVEVPAFMRASDDPVAASAVAAERVAAFRSQYPATPPSGMSMDTARTWLRDRRAALDALVQELAPMADGMALPVRNGGTWLVSREARPDGSEWRITRFDKNMVPQGHEAHRAAADAVADLVTSVDVSRLNKWNPAFMRAYHGTPHSFDKFSTDKIGTGEGAQAFGWGLYFAGKKEVAQHYRKALSEGRVSLDGAPADGSTPRGMGARLIADLMSSGMSFKEAKEKATADAIKFRDAAQREADALQKRVGEPPAPGWGTLTIEDSDVEMERQKARYYAERANALESIRDGSVSTHKGNLYEVEIPEENEYLLWDKPLSEQPTKVREALDQMLGGASYETLKYFSGADSDSYTGKDLYTNLKQSFFNLAQPNDAKAASEAMAALGIKGIKYLDGTSRADGDGTYNYVVFSADDVEIQNQPAFMRQNEGMANRKGKGAPTPDTSLKQGRPDAGMQERPTVRAVSGSLGEPAQSGGGAGSDANDTPFRVVDLFGNGSRVQHFDDRRGLFYEAQRYPSGRVGWKAGEIVDGNESWLSDKEYPTMDAAIASVRGQRAANTRKANFDAKYGDIPNTWKGEAKKVAMALIDAGHEIDRFSNSTQSTSKYIYLDNGAKVRLADHNLPGSYDQPDFDFRYGDDIAEFVASIPNESPAPNPDGAPQFSRTPQTETKAFKDWFGESKVVDAEGKPLVVFHSSTFGDFSTFDKAKQHKGMAGYGFYFSDAHGANIYADYGANFQAEKDWQGNEKKLNIMPVYLAIQNPLVADNIAEVRSRFGKADPGNFGQDRKYGGMSETAQTAIQRAGYDGVIANEYVTRQKDGSYKVVEPGAKGAIKHPVYVAFEPNQIKSALGNRGTFDPKDPDIRFSRTNAAQTEDTEPVRPELSPWRDATGRLQFAPGAWLWDKLGTASGPILNKLQLKAATPELRRIMRQMKLDVAKAQEVAAAVAGEATKLTEDERAMVSDLIEKELKAGTVPPEHAVRLAAMINSSMEQQTNELVRLGMLTKDSADRWRGQYLPRYYESKLTEKAGDLWADAMRSITRRPSAMKGIKGKHLRGRGLYETIPESQLEDYKTMGWEVRDPDYQPGVTTDGTVQVWRDFTRQERDKMGEIRDAGFRFVMGYMQTQKDIALGKMFEQLAIDPEMSSRLETEKFSVRVPDGKAPGTEVKTYGKLAGRYVTPETLSQLSLIEESQSEALMMYRKALGIWKEGKALALDTPIPTPSGWTTMGALQPGDQVFDEKGRPCEVTFATPVQMDRECFEVEFSDGCKIVADAEHLWLTKYHGVESVKTTKRILETLKYAGGQYNAHSVPVAGPLTLPDQTLPIDPYYLGVWLGNGTARNTAITSCQADGEVIMGFLRDRGLGIGAVRKDPRGDCITYSVGFDGYRPRRELLQPTMRALNLLQNKHIPAIYLRASEQQRLDLLCGLMDTDGTISERGQLEFCTTTEALKDGIVELARSLGFKPRARKQTAAGNNQVSWLVKFHGYDDRPVFALPRKIARLRKAPETRQRSSTRQIVAITPVASVPVKCIQVSSESRLYLAGEGMIPTHNTVLNPVSHVNNTISNMSMAHFAGVSYGRADKYLAAMRDFAKKSPMILEAKDNGLFLGTLSEAELMNTLPEDLKALAQKQEGAAEKVGRTTFNLMTFYLRRPMGWAYQAEDTFFRYLIYKDARGRGMEPQDAVDYAQRYIFTYDDLPKNARRIRDFGIPFFAYTYKAVPVLLNTALTHPERLAAPAAVLWTINAAAYAIAAGDDEDDWDVKLRRYLTDPEYREKARAKEKLERELLPEWNKGTTSLMTPKVIRLGNDELTKLPMFIDVSRIIPGGDLFDVNPNAGGIGLPQPITPSHPLFTTAVAMLANKDLFFGKDLTDSNDTAGEKFDKRAAWMWKQLTPAITVNNYHFERGMNALAQAAGGEVKYVPDFLGGDSTGIGRDGLPVQPKLAAMQTFGIKVRPYDLDAAESIQESAKQKLIRDIDTELRKLRRLENKGAVSDRTAEKERELANLKKDRLRDGKTVDGEDR